MLNESGQVTLLKPHDARNSHKLAYSGMENIMLAFEGNLVKKKHSFRIMMSDVSSGENVKREAVVSELDMTLRNELYYQKCHG